MKMTYIKPVFNVEKAQPESIICTSTVGGNVGINFGGGGEQPRVKEQDDDNFWEDEW